MVRPLRIEYENAFYHVMNRGRGRENIFLSARDYKQFLYCIDAATQRFNCEIHAYCLMTNHYHILIKTPDANLGKVMKHINGLYTQWFNRNYHKDGALFRGRYKAILVDADSYLLHVSRYIHRNPIETSIPMVNELVDYRWSSYPMFLNKRQTPAWLYKNFTFALQNKRQKIAAYKRYVEGELNEEVAAFYGAKKQLSVLGSDLFIKWVKDNFLTTNSETQFTALRYDIDDIIVKVAGYFNVTPYALLQSIRGVKGKNIPRSFAIKLCQDLTGATLIEIADRFNLGHYSSVSKAVGRLNACLHTDKCINAEFKRLRNNF
ncbi:transposase [uncultured Pseudoalteromonas sp.]|uniref:transposase n=1 Tax=uncultured Pseudoalteromonas sp. TaxID=114053 RepID=UPI0030D8C1CC|tara:strand:- start:540 stop:1496 length:957 start_codon:yes stop_codon:yes gene_type:complete